MPSDLVRTSSFALTQAQRQLSAIERHAQVEAMRVEAVHFVARMGQAAVADLTAFEEREGKASPTAAVRLMAVGDTATSAIAMCVLRVGAGL
jgi:hypothetical protein